VREHGLSDPERALHAADRIRGAAQGVGLVFGERRGEDQVDTLGIHDRRQGQAHTSSMPYWSVSSEETGMTLRSSCKTASTIPAAESPTA
jgi:hypothetical protein